MAEEKLLTIRDVSIILGASEKEVIDLAERGQIPAYKVGGVYLRFKRQQVEDFKKRFKPPPQKKIISQSSSLKEKIDDFFYFNDFYILAFLLILLIVVIIFKGY
ncbi:DNA-binding protein [bacterium]|nr:MAG: DNA-binding protein [bacterium]